MPQETGFKSGKEQITLMQPFAHQLIAVAALAGGIGFALILLRGTHGRPERAKPGRCPTCGELLGQGDGCRCSEPRAY